MIDLSLAGLVGAMAGTVVAAAIYYMFIGPLERAMRAHMPLQTAEERNAASVELSIMRRAVLTIDLFVFVALGYWLGRMLDE